MILEKRVNGTYTWNIKHSDEYKFDVCCQYRAKIVKHYLHLGKRYALSQKDIDDEAEKAREEEKYIEDMKKRDAAKKKKLEVKT